MKHGLLKLTILLVILFLLVSFVYMVLGALGAVDVTDDCMLRYQEKDGMLTAGTDVFNNSTTLRATGNYTMQVNQNTGQITAAGVYGQWVNTRKRVLEGQDVNFAINGKVSLCKSYIPQYNLTTTSNTNHTGDRIPIDRVDGMMMVKMPFDSQTAEWRNIIEMYTGDEVKVTIEPTTDRLKNIFTNEWLEDNCTEEKEIYKANCGRFTAQYGRSENYLEHCQSRKESEWGDTGQRRCPGDPTQSCGHNYLKWMRTNTTTGLGKLSTTSYGDWVPDGPVVQCVYLGGPESSASYGVTGSKPGVSVDEDWIQRSTMKQCSRVVMGYITVTYWDPVYITSIAYRNDGSRTLSYDDAMYGQPADSVISQFYSPNNELTQYDCRVVSQKNKVNSQEYRNKQRYWHVAENATGLLWRKDSTEVPTNKEVRGGDYSIVNFVPQSSTMLFDSNIAAVGDDNEDEGILGGITEVSIGGKSVRETKEVEVTPDYLQLRYFNNDGEIKEDEVNGGAFIHNRGGYVIGVQHTKCVRENGYAMTDPGFASRGSVQYVIMPTGEDPNVVTELTETVHDIDFNKQESSYATIDYPHAADKNGVIWARILNKTEDYPDSEGTYLLRISTETKYEAFVDKILNPLLNMVHEVAIGAGYNMFKNMTCYGDPTNTNCFNFFNYVKALLSLYVVSYGLMFLLGAVQISQQDLLIRVVKIGLVSGLMTGHSFDFFAEFIFPIVANFSATIISNVSGFDLYETAAGVPNPFIFLDAVVSRILISATFWIQLFALWSVGLSGIVYFLVVAVSVALFMITVARCLSIYIISLLGLALMIGMAPFFLTFMLFEVTKPIFDKWVTYVIRYMMEPVVLLVGMVIFTQLFTIYLDIVISYSVCWKCTLTFKLPFLLLAVLPESFLNIPIFCINWFGPWGYGGTGEGADFALDISQAAALMMITWCMYNYPEFSSNLTSNLVGGGGGSATKGGLAMASGIKNAAQFSASKAAGAAKGLANKVRSRGGAKQMDDDPRKNDLSQDAMSKDGEKDKDKKSSGDSLSGEGKKALKKKAGGAADPQKAGDKSSDEGGDSGKTGQSGSDSSSDSGSNSSSASSGSTSGGAGSSGGSTPSGGGSAPTSGS